MNPNALFFLEFVIFSGVALAWGIYEIWKTRREIARDKAKRASEEAPRHPER